MWQVIKPVMGTSEAYKDVGTNIYQQNIKGIDKIAEDACIDYIKKNDVSIKLISEESGTFSFGDDPKYTLIVDPIDGSTNASRGVPFFSLSLALLDGTTFNDVIAGLVRAPLLLKNNLFEVVKGRDIKVDGKPIKPQPIEEKLSKAIVSIYVYDTELELVKPVASKAYKTRLFGSIALEVCYTATGLLDALIDTRGTLKIMDFVAAKLFIEEAGGIITDMEGKLLTSNVFELSERFSIVCASNRSLHQEIINLLG
jgi:myo-inositol-1(or 4)-monophosphatase